MKDRNFLLGYRDDPAQDLFISAQTGFKFPLHLFSQCEFVSDMLEQEVLSSYNELFVVEPVTSDVSGLLQLLPLLLLQFRHPKVERVQLPLHKMHLRLSMWTWLPPLAE